MIELKKVTPFRIFELFNGENKLFIQNNTVFGVKLNGKTYILKKFDVDLTGYEDHNKEAITKEATIFSKNLMKEECNFVNIIMKNGETIHCSCEIVKPDFYGKISLKKVFDKDGNEYQKDLYKSNCEKKINGEFVDIAGEAELEFKEVVKSELNEKIKDVLDMYGFKTIKNNKVSLERPVKTVAKRDPEKKTYFNSEYYNLKINKEMFLFYYEDEKPKANVQFEYVYLGHYSNKKFIFEKKGKVHLKHSLKQAFENQDIAIIEKGL